MFKLRKKERKKDSRKKERKKERKNERKKEKKVRKKRKKENVCIFFDIGGSFERPVFEISSVFDCIKKQARVQGYKTFFMLNTVEHEILNAPKNKKIKKFG